MEAPKVTFSEAEHRLITDTDVILTKNSALEKIGSLFAVLASAFQPECQPLSVRLPAIFSALPKISKGEKHKGFPWMMLDYPRSFSNTEGHLAIRCFFWWGHYFSIHLQVSGKHLLPVLRQSGDWLITNGDWYSGLTEDAWDLVLPPTEWRTIPSNVGDLSDCAGLTLKIAKKIPIGDWEAIEKNFRVAYTGLLNLLTNAFMHQDGEKAP